MAMTNRANIKRDGLIMSTLDDLVPQDHLVRTLEATIDWKVIYPLVKSLYSNFGRRSIDPVVLFKMIFINYTFGINSLITALLIPLLSLVMAHIEKPTRILEKLQIRK